jgi:hypothetical protein
MYSSTTFKQPAVLSDEALMYRLQFLVQRYRRLLRSFAIAIVTISFSALALAQSSQWLIPTKPDDPLVWGRRDGIVFGLSSPGGIKGPRGLIRIGLFTPDKSEPQLLNYIAVEPVVLGAGPRMDRMAFSELEMSEMDPGERGKRMWVGPASAVDKSLPLGTLQTLHAGEKIIERLSVRINVEKFSRNGAHVYLIASIDSDHPSELRLSTFAEDDSPPLEEFAVSATMGNYERLRLLWLKDRVEDSRKVFADYTGEAFVEGDNYPLDDMLRSGGGDAIVFCTSNERNPRESPGNDSAHWVYSLPKITQYWRVPGHDIEPDLRVRVNARRVYWASTAPVLGGIAFENFEVRQRFVAGQTFIFGITTQEPWDFYRGLSRLVPQ